MDYQALQKNLRECLSILRKIKRTSRRRYLNNTSDQLGFDEHLQKNLSKKLNDVVSQSLEHLTDKHRLNVLAELPLVRQMDYLRHKIYLRVLSRPEYKTRLRSCQKEPWTIKWIEDFVRPGDVMYDVGANVGTYSLVAAMFAKKQLQVFAFEPSFATYSSLCHNIILNDCQDSIIPLPIALSSKTGLVDLELSSLEPGKGLHVFDKSRQTGRNGNTARYKQLILTYKLDDLVNEFNLPVPNHLKVDVDGTELDVLRGAGRTISDERVRSLMIEVNEDEYGSDRELVEELQTKGFQLSSRSKREDAPGKTYKFSYCLFSRAMDAV